jgi:hypothetical protein
MLTATPGRVAVQAPRLVPDQLLGAMRIINIPGLAPRLADRHRWIVPQLVVMVEAFVTKRNPEHTRCRTKVATVVSDLIRPATIAKAVCKPIHQINGPIGRTQ